MGVKKGPQMTRISDITIFVGTFCPHSVRFARSLCHSDTHTHGLLVIFQGWQWAWWSCYSPLGSQRDNCWQLL